MAGAESAGSDAEGDVQKKHEKRVGWVIVAIVIAVAVASIIALAVAMAPHGEAMVRWRGSHNEIDAALRWGDRAGQPDRIGECRRGEPAPKGGVGEILYCYFLCERIASGPGRDAFP